MGGGCSAPKRLITRRKIGTIYVEEQECFVEHPNSPVKKRLPSTYNLQMILTQSHMSEKLRDFVQKKWTPPKLDDVYYSSAGKSIALNFIDFLSDSRDFLVIPPSNFQYYRACHIFQRYIMHGATKQIPLKITVVDDCTKALFGGGGDAQDSNLFSCAIAEALDFLVAEVYPAFEAEPESRYSKFQNDKVADALKETQLVRSLSGRVLNAVSRKQNKTRTAIMNKILNDPEGKYINVFRQYAKKKNKHQVEGMIFAYNLLKDMEVKIRYLAECCDPSNAEANMLTFMHLVHQFYDKYLSFDGCARRKIGLTDASRGDFLQKITKCSKPDYEVLSHVETTLLDSIQRMHLTDFLASNEYRELERSGRYSVCVMAGSLSDTTLDSERCSTEHTNPLRIEILAFLRSEYDVVFGRYLEEHKGDISEMHFVQSVLRYRDMKYSHDVDLIVDCSNIFERYVSRNAVERVLLPPDISTNISKHMFQADQRLYDEALDWVIKRFSADAWPKFKAEILRKAAEENSDSSKGNSLSLRSYVSKDEDEFIGMDLTNSATTLTGEKYLQRTLDSIRRSSEATIPNMNGFAPYVRLDGNQYSEAAKFKDILHNARSCALFKEFLDNEGTSQTILFQMEIEEYRKIPDFRFQLSRARKIYNKFIHTRGAMTVPVSHSVRSTILAAVEAQETPPNLFAQALKEVLEYMENNQFPRFLISSYALRLKDCMQEKIIATREDSYSSTVLDAVSAKLGDIRSLRDVLHYPVATRFFKSYCERSYCTESLYFWLDAENYANVPGSDFRKRTAAKICQKYISDKAKMQINISSTVKQQILSELQEPSREIFRRAQAEVYSLMEKDSLQKFVTAMEYSQMKACIAELGANNFIVDLRRNPVKQIYEIQGI